MTLLPKRTAVFQVAAQIKADIEAGKWRKWLPNEREFSRQLRVCRSTLRSALTQLEQAGITKVRHGIGHMVVKGSKKASGQQRNVCILTPQPLAQLRPHVALWVDEMKSLIHGANCELTLQCAPSLYRSHPAHALQRMLKANPAACWILMRSTPLIQHWFKRHNVPCVVAGSCFPGIDLPSVTIDHRAITRHAVGELLRNGHRRVALLTPAIFAAGKIAAAGDIESEQGFIEAARASAHSGVDAVVVRYKEPPSLMIGSLRRLLDRKNPPTGLVIANSNYYLTVITELARRRLCVPDDMSIISRDDDPFLDYIFPTPARYVLDPKLFASKMATTTLCVVERCAIGNKHIKLLLEYVPGLSVAAVGSNGKSPGKSGIA